MSARDLFAAISSTQGDPNAQASLLSEISQKYGSATNFYREVAKELGISVDHVIHEVEKMAMSPQTSLNGARAQTPVPQATPPQLNPNKVDNQMQMMQQQGMGTAQAVNKAAINPQNQFKDGGDVSPPDPSQLDTKMRNSKIDPSQIDDVVKGLKGSPVMKDLKDKTDSKDPTLDMFEQYDTKEGSEYLKKRNEIKNLPRISQQQWEPNFKSGGDVHSKIKNMSLKDIIKLLASHPGLAGQGAGNGNSPMQGMNMREGGAVGGQNDPDAMQKRPGLMGKSTPSKHGLGIMNMNADVQTYASGGNVMGNGMGNGGEVQNDDDQSTNGDLMAEAGAGNTSAATMMAKGGNAPPPGSLSKEVADDIPAKLSEGEFVFSADVVRFYGLQKLTAMMQYAREQLSGMNDEGTISTPKEQPKGNGLMGQFMQDQEPNEEAYQDSPEEESQEQEFDSGGPVNDWEKETGSEGAKSVGPHEYAGPFGRSQSNKWIKDNISEKDKLGYVSKELKNTYPQEKNGDQNPDRNRLNKDTYTYDKNALIDTNIGKRSNANMPVLKNANEKKKGGLLKKATGGGVFEDTFSKGGAPEYGRDNMVSSHPKGGSPLMDFAKGGFTSPKIKPSKAGMPQRPNTTSYGVNKIKKSGLLSAKVPEQSFIGS